MSNNSNEQHNGLHQLCIDDACYETLYTSKFANRKVWEEPDEQEVKTFIPGTVISLNVEEGSTVKAGDVLMTFEAMKMLNLVKAPYCGTVQSLQVKEGDKLPKGCVMLKVIPKKK